MMLDGDVTAFIRRGDLIIRGDSEDNQILITQEDGVVVIEGDETTVNGEESVELPMFTRDLLIRPSQDAFFRASLPSWTSSFGRWNSRTCRPRDTCSRAHVSTITPPKLQRRSSLARPPAGRGRTPMPRRR